MIRALEIPGFQPTSLNQPEASPNVAAAPAAALGSVAQAIGAVGQTFEGIADRIQGAENARAESEARQTWLQGWGNLQADLTRDPDPASHIRRTQEFLQQQRGTIDAPDLAPVVRDRLGLQFDDFATRALNQTTANASNLSIQRAKLALDNEFDAALRSGNRAAYERAKDTALTNGVILPEEAAKLDQEFEHTALRNDLLNHAASDPAGFIETYGDTPPEGINAVEHQQILGTARASLARDTAATSDEILDGIAAGNITTPEQIEELTPNLRPAARQRLQAELAEQASAATRAVRASPGYQASTVARVEEMLDGYTVEADGYDTAFVEMSTLVRSLPPGAVRDELGRRLEQSRAGQFQQIETAADFHRQALSDLTKAGAFGTGTVQKSVADILADGILRDPAKLQRRGFTPEQAAEIVAAENEPARIMKFRELSKARAGQDASTPYERAALDAIQSGRAGMVEVEDLAAREKSRRAAGLAKTQLETWLKANPNATEEQGRQKLLEIAGQTAIPGMVDQILTAPPTLQPPAVGTRFGTEGDSSLPTPWGDGTGGDLLPPPPEE